MQINYDFDSSIFQADYKPGKLQTLISNFVETNKPYAKVVFQEGEYPSAKNLYGAVYGAVRKSRRDIQCKLINENVYLVRNSWLRDVGLLRDSH